MRGQFRDVFDTFSMRLIYARNLSLIRYVLGKNGVVGDQMGYLNRRGWLGVHG